jgi:hypothetical protein
VRLASRKHPDRSRINKLSFGVFARIGQIKIVYYLMVFRIIYGHNARILDAKLNSTTGPLS